MSFYSVLIATMLLAAQYARAQELFPMNEPASTMPGGVFGIRVGSHIHYKYQTVGHREIVRLMIGCTPKLTLLASSIQSNFHQAGFPDDLNEYFRTSHHHRSSSGSYPYAFDAVSLYAKYRFLTSDGRNKHHRVASFAEAAYSDAKHVDAFPSLMGDASGISMGLIGTKLQKRFAASLTAGVTTHFGYSTQGSESVFMKPGNAAFANLSLGYLIHPKKYTSLDNLNVNAYLELNARRFEDAEIVRDGYAVNINSFGYLKAGSFLTMYPSVQVIVNSSIRCEIAFECPLYYANNLERFYMLVVNVQKYFF